MVGQAQVSVEAAPVLKGTQVDAETDFVEALLAYQTLVHNILLVRFINVEQAGMDHLLQEFWEQMHKGICNSVY